MKQARIEELLLANGWTKDRHGHFLKDIGVENKATGMKSLRKHRVKMGSVTCKIECQVTREVWTQDGWKMQPEWVRVSPSEYFTKITLTGTGDLRIGKTMIQLKNLPPAESSSDDGIDTKAILAAIKKG